MDNLSLLSQFEAITDRIRNDTVTKTFRYEKGIEHGDERKLETGAVSGATYSTGGTMVIGYR